MFIQPVEENNNTRDMISTWLGYNHNYKIQDGEFFDMLNLTSDNYPLMSPRKKRTLLLEGTNFRGIMLSGSNLCYLEGATLHYNSLTFDLSDYTDADDTTQQQIVRYGAYILIHPMKVAVNPSKQTITPWVETFKADVGVTITYQMCDVNGAAVTGTAGDTAPTNPSNGDRWICTKAGSEGVYQWNSSQAYWMPVATSYIKITVPGANFNGRFKENDVIEMNSRYPLINEGSTIQALGTDYIIVIGYMDNGVTYNQTTSNGWTLEIKRKVPEMEFICVDDNRIWGCHYGYKTNSYVNEIYASRLGDFSNWYAYEGLATDSYAATVGIDGPWTGCITYQGYPTFFKENAVYKVYGTYPAEYQVIQDTIRGVQEGSWRSLCVLDEYLVYKSPTDIVVYDGSTPSTISLPLGRELHFYDAVGGACQGKYHIMMKTANGTPYYFIYDIHYGMWTKESPLEYVQFTSSENGQMYGATADKLYGIGNNDNILYLNEQPGEEYVEWFAETGDFGLEEPDYKYLQRITIRAYIPFKSEIQVYVCYNNTEWEQVTVMRGNDEIVTHSAAISPYRCDHYRIRLSGHGDCRVYTLTTTVDYGSEEESYVDRN